MSEQITIRGDVVSVKSSTRTTTFYLGSYVSAGKAIAKLHDELEQLWAIVNRLPSKEQQAEIERLRAALREIAEFADVEGDEGDDLENVAVSAIAIAKIALFAKGGGDDE